eukprot:CAMPEP_0195304934 /NCGR_PEP_ID=MMETSP0707-20130614/35393_1 /TAXON_ID=33640 /ORGANISM="Asterionellopsis glacialis, Strain CCMP134" /LENGTH=328 /DNA_ID=CAMNT_0040368905 /DNA_START=98 /DNA_END=1084 /DNA_ORIENTATION=+
MDHDDFLLFCQELKDNDPSICEVYTDNDSRLEEVCESMVQNTKVNTLSVELSTMDENGSQALNRLLQRNVTMKRFEIDCSNMKDAIIDEKGLQRFADAFAHCHLQEIQLDGVCKDMGYGGAIGMFGFGLSQNTTIRMLRLLECHLDDHDALAIGKILKASTCMESLLIHSCSISEAGIQHICDGMKRNCTITHVDFYHTPVSSNGIIAISDMLKKNSSIKTLELERQEDIGDEARKALVRAVEENFTLEVISIDDQCSDLLEYFAWCNTNGQRQSIMKQTNLPMGLWAHIFARCWKRIKRISQTEILVEDMVDVLFYFVKSKLELFKS